MLPQNLNNNLILKRVGSSTNTKPLVSWVMPTTLTKHRWWKRLGEFLSEDFPANQIEFVILGMQDKDFAEKAYEEGKKIAGAYAFLEGAQRRWENVTFAELYEPNNDYVHARALNILREISNGDILIYRDADCMLLQYGFTKFMLDNLVKNRLGLLGVPSILNGFPFKPKESDITTTSEHYKDILLDSTVNGMATCGLRAVDELLGGWNEASPVWTYTHHCSKLAQAGFLMGYATKQGGWLASSDKESPITLSDISRDPTLMQKKEVAYLLLSKFYDLQPKDIFYNIAKRRYSIDSEQISEEVEKTAKSKYELYETYQKLTTKTKLFDFKPWECLSKPETEDYINSAKDRADYLFAPIEQKMREIGI